MVEGKGGVEGGGRGARRGVSLPKLETLKPPMGVADPGSYRPLPTCHHAEFGSSATKGALINKREPPKIGQN